MRHSFLTASPPNETVHHSLNRETDDKTVQQSTLQPIFHLGSCAMTTVQINGMIQHIHTLQENEGVKTQFKAQLRVKQPRFWTIQFEI